MATTTRTARRGTGPGSTRKDMPDPPRRRTDARPSSAAREREVTGRLFDGAGADRDVSVDATVIRKLGRQQTLWVDLVAPDRGTLERVAELFDLRPGTVRALLEEEAPRVAFLDDYLVLGVNAIESVDADGVIPLVMVAGRSFVITLHRERAACLDAFREHLQGDTAIGLVDGPAFLAALLDWHVTIYFQAVDRLEREADKLDHRALHPRSERDLLAELVQLRRRISELRRALAPQREVFAALTRPELAGLGDPDDTVHFRALADRLERAIDAVEVARELVLGSFDVYMTRMAQRTNDVMKLLTLVTVILLPGSVIAGVMGMNFQVPLFDEPAWFWVVIVAMGAIAVATLIVARSRRWI